MPPLFDLRRLAVGARVHAPLLVAEVERRSYGENACTVLTLANATGRLASAPFWNAEQETVAEIGRGDVVEVVGEVGVFRDKRQLKVATLRALPRRSVEWRSLLPSVGDVQRCWAPLDRWRGEIRRPRLRDVLALFFDDPAFRARFESCPASLSGHHARLGGLLQHTWEVAAIGRATAALYDADVDLVLAGALLHDIGKLEAYRWEGCFEITDPGALLGHPALGALMLERRIAGAHPPACTADERTILLHLILSHHGKLEFGAAVTPMTLEAEILHHADDTSAKATNMADALGDPDNFLRDARLSARSLWQLDRRRAWRGESDWGDPEGKKERPPSRG